MKYAWVAAKHFAGMVAPIAAQEADLLAECRAVSDSLERLTCYDSINVSEPFGSQPVARGGGFKKVDIDDFKVDKDTMTGQKVELSGQIMHVGEMVMLTSGQMDMSPIVVEFDSIPRDQKLRIVQRCAMGCRATVRGEVGGVFFQTGIIASSISTR